MLGSSSALRRAQSEEKSGVPCKYIPRAPLKYPRGVSFPLAEVTATPDCVRGGGGLGIFHPDREETGKGLSQPGWGDSPGGFQVSLAS